MTDEAQSGPFQWLRSSTPHERRTLIAGSLGWMLDAFDVMLYAMVMVDLQAHFGLDNRIAGLIPSLTLFSSALGGALFGMYADRRGRTRALMLSILIYSVASGATGFAQTVLQLSLFRLILGLGMGGEWTAGAALVAESWRARHRGKALALMQSSWAIGEMLAAGVAGALLPLVTITIVGIEFAPWRAVFFAGVIPALLVVWVRSSVEEPAIWKQSRQQAAGGRRVPLSRLWQPDIRRNAIVATLMNSATMFGYWGLFTWVPAFLAKPIAEGGRGFEISEWPWWVVLMGVGKWFGYVLFGYVADAAGRRRAYMIYLVMAGLLVPVFVSLTSPLLLMIVAPLVAFFGTGHYSGFAAIASELFPTEIRGTALGITYNIGRAVGALAPFLIGALADRYGLNGALLATSAAFLLAAALASLLPETRGRELA